MSDHFNTHIMEYRHLGSSGIKVSVIGFGNWLNSNNPEDHKRTLDIVKTAWEQGINFFDTAEIYGNNTLTQDSERQKDRWGQL